MRALKYIYFVFTCLPFVWLALFIAFAIRATLKLGHAPIPSTDDPQYLDFDFHHNLIWFLFLALVYIVPPYWMVMTIVAKIKKRNDFYLLRNTLIFGGGAVAILCLFYFDPYKLTMWFAD